ncbi:hypothetical protein M422DRAFT_270851 [Sphaerobolus stellatus SS14]|uniref:BHLH domain-containing protein n=1 Tax=Sphaerobolus stellatus (strain SS14) TaxID=990650 RepID=A0A0C9URU0_SPHS4|nr:hypothetical protein M422DRAFT_270851 [Sphaerobolus stellatus SS14]
MAAFYPTQPTALQPKVRQEGFDTPQPPSPSTTPAAPFDPNMFFGHHLFNGSTPATTQVDHHIPHSYKPHGDFSDEIAAMMGDGSGGGRPTSPHAPASIPHNPFDTNTTVPYNHRPHNIFDVSSPATSAFPAHFSLPSTTSHHPHAPTQFDTSYPDFRGTSRSRSRSKVPAESSNGGRVSRPKRGSISSTSPRPHSPHTHGHSRPQAILIPPPTNGHNHHPHPVSPLSLHMHAQTAPSAWFMDSPFRGSESFRTADSPFSLPTPDSIGVHHPFSGPGSLPTGLSTGSPKSVSAKESPPPSGTHDTSKQAQLASEKRRRRRESHNAVERRRRDNINEKISELATLIPECMLDPNAATSADLPDPFSPDTEDSKNPLTTPTGNTTSASAAAAAAAAAAAGPVKANKGMILRKSVEYIRYLQQLVNAQATRNRELEAQLAHGSPHGLNGVSGGLGMGESVPSLTMTDSESPGSLKVVDEVEDGEEHDEGGEDGGFAMDEEEDFLEEDEERGRKRDRVGGEVRVKREEAVGMEE